MDLARPAKFLSGKFDALARRKPTCSALLSTARWKPAEKARESMVIFGQPFPSLPNGGCVKRISTKLLPVPQQLPHIAYLHTSISNQEGA